ncbi:MAG: zeta toxin family protein [Deltaproteobacteria bacterium]|nr:zeta toxin family protein [Deltaproteobacteria bacterium]
MGCIDVFAGTNGAGKSSVVGEAARARGALYFNPDEVARQIRAVSPDFSDVEVNAAAWSEGKRLLEKAIAQDGHFAFETTLGGNTIPGLLARAAAKGLEVRIWYVGLASPELHIARVRARVAKGGHDIPEAKIRERYDLGRENLIALLPKLTELWVYDNSFEADPAAGLAPRPVLLLHYRAGKIVAPKSLARTPAWAKPIIAAALRLTRAS